MSLTGTYTIQLLSVTPLAIHGSPYFDIVFTVEGETVPVAMRINPEALYAEPKKGDRVQVSMMMGNILSAQKVEH
jgi:hypothetical protein